MGNIKIEKDVAVGKLDVLENTAKLYTENANGLDA